MEWSFQDDRPIYAQIMEHMKRFIVSGTFPPGSKLPSVRELAAQAEVNPNTMQKALSELERSGLVFSQRTSGRFITEDQTMIQTVKEELATEQITAFLSAMEKLGFNREQTLSILEKWKQRP